MTERLDDVLRDVLAVPEARRVLLHLCQSASPLQYSALRRAVDLHPETFKRLLSRMERHAMVGRRLRGPANNLGYREVFLEPTYVGRFWADRWLAWQRDTVTEAAAHRLPLQV